MSYLLHRDHVLMPLHTSPPADRLGVALKSILTLNQYSSRFCWDSSKKCVKITNQIKSNNFGHGKKEKNKSSQYGGFDSRC